jgi:hypothetical protein
MMEDWSKIMDKQKNLFGEEEERQQNILKV